MKGNPSSSTTIIPQVAREVKCLYEKSVQRSKFSIMGLIGFLDPFLVVLEIDGMATILESLLRSVNQFI